eukprot:TRINITY_DN886_c0_g1_i4.p1 TRINITY_DN886_c0_g1~~TRINITY_DN886_c0_g1_i4.p1  ORF type:complete len:286 (+),score=110.22 TRINITY_DN886_c0_g1_i4:208-1065(+)
MNKKGTTVGQPGKFNYSKDQVLRVMHEVLLDSVDYLLKYSNTVQEISKKATDKDDDETKLEIEKLSERLHGALLELENDVCLLRSIDIEKYYEDVTQYDNMGDPEVRDKLNLLGKLIENASKGEKIVVDFEFPKELTKEKTLKLYKLILMTHLHLHYTSVQKYLVKYSNASTRELEQVIDEDEVERVKRREKIMEKEMITRKPDEDYRMILHAAYYTYLTHDPEFEKQIQKILSLYQNLLHMIKDKAEIPELKLDPITMNYILFDEFYNRLNSKYLYGPSIHSLI